MFRRLGFHVPRSLEQQRSITYGPTTPSLPCPARVEYSEYSGATLAKPSAAQCRVNTSLGRKSSPCWHSGYSLYAGRYCRRAESSQPFAPEPNLISVVAG
jgi:hypothetical protein